MNINRISVYLDEMNLPFLEKEETSMVYENVGYNEPEQIYNILCQGKYHRRATENVCMLLMDGANHIISLCELSKGSVNRSLVTNREVCQTALLGGAVGVVLTHNHPSGDPTPSDMDIAVTEQIKNALEMVGVKLLDHIILGMNSYVSMMEQGILK